MEETIAAISTAPGRSGVAVVRISGLDAFALAKSLIAGEIPKPGRTGLRKVCGEPCLMLVFAAPHSFTGEDVVEIHCHGGAIAPKRVLAACFAAGARLARRGEFTQRAFLNGKISVEEAEAVIDLIDAKTTRAAEAALAGFKQRHHVEFRKLYDEAVDISTVFEHALDVDESDLPGDFHGALNARMAQLAVSIKAQIRSLNEGRILREGALVVLAGPPNAGKSSLMNALLGENRAIVSAAAGTTRDSIEEWIDIEGWPVRIVDTAGLRETSDEIEAEGVRRTNDLVGMADLVVALDIPSQQDIQAKAIAVHSKCDLGRKTGVLNVSSLTGEGLKDLKKAIAEALEAACAAAGDSCCGADAGSNAQSLAILVSALRELEKGYDAPDLAIAANSARNAASRLAGLTGAEYSSDMLDRLFSRFCVGK